MKKLIPLTKSYFLENKFAKGLKSELTEKIPILYLSELSKRTSNPYSDIDDLYGITFIHVPKTAGTSIFEQFFGLSHHGHFRPIHYYKYDKSKFLQSRKVAVVRNPWDKFISAYHYIEQNLEPGSYGDRFKKQHFQGVDDFSLFKERFLNCSDFRSNITKWDHFRPQWDFISLNDDYCVNTLGRFEKINDFIEEFKTIISHSDGSVLEKRNDSKRGDYRSYYCDSLINAVGELYRKEIDFLGYEY